MADMDGTIGIGNYKYAIVLCKLSTDYWHFVPLQTLESTETDRAFREFCAGVEKDVAQLVAYCDAHPSLIRVCDNHGISKRHSPPGTPRANSVIERKIGHAIEGIRALLFAGVVGKISTPV